MRSILNCICLLAGVLLFSAGTASSQNWLETLRQQPIVDSIVLLTDKNPMPSLPYRSYMIYYHQPLEHGNPTGEQFQLRALLTVNPANDVSTAVNHMHIGGYRLFEELIANPNLAFVAAIYSANEIAHRYKANYIQPEYRYFSKSAPANCWSRMEHMRSDEAADDFHALVTALKTVFYGKWAISGVSKGGVATVTQFTFHPEDADVFVPYVAPIFDTDRDTVMQQYWMQAGWTKEWRDLYLGFQQKMLYNREKIFPMYYKMQLRNEIETPAKKDSLKHAYLSSICNFGFGDRAYRTLDSIQQDLDNNVRILAATGFSGYTDTVCSYMVASEELSLKGFKKWIDTLRAYPDAATLPSRQVPRKYHMPSEEYEQAKPYYYQAKVELGYYDLRFDSIVHAGDEALAAQLNQQCSVLGPYIDFVFSSNHQRQYSRTLYTQITTALQNAAKPVFFVYGVDDPWTGAAISEQFLNGTTTREFVFAFQNHEACFSKPSDLAQSKALTDALDAILGNPQGLDKAGEEPTIQCKKLLINGQLILFINNEKYDITGKKYR